ncbi:MAG: hypothetical protein JSV24_07905, partial [Bacteroidales bacterium]
QDIPEVAKFSDYLSPMTYAHMVKQEPTWINSVVNDIHEQAEGKIIPSIQVDKAYLESELTLAEFKESVIEALKPPSSGIVFWSWETLDRDQQKKNFLKNALKPKN